MIKDIIMRYYDAPEPLHKAASQRRKRPAATRLFRQKTDSESQNQLRSRCRCKITHLRRGSIEVGRLILAKRQGLFSTTETLFWFARHLIGIVPILPEISASRLPGTNPGSVPSSGRENECAHSPCGGVFKVLCSPIAKISPIWEIDKCECLVQTELVPS